MLSLFLVYAPFALAETVEVAKIAGHCQLNGKPIHSGETLTAQGTLECGAGESDYIDFVYEGGHKMRLKHGGSLQLNGKMLDLKAGQLFLHFEKRKNADQFQVRTRAVVAGVRGTEYMIEESAKGSYICVCDGLVAVTPRDYAAAKSVKAGEDIWARDGKLEEPKASASMVKMTADEFKAMGTR